MTVLCWKCYWNGYKVPAVAMAEGRCLCDSHHDEAQQRAYDVVYRPKA